MTPPPNGPTSSATEPDGPAVLMDRRGFVGILTLNRPGSRNAMTPELFAGFEAALDWALREEARGAIRCLVVTGTGSCFSAGADLRGSLQADPAPGPGGRDAAPAAAPVALPHERSFAMYEPFMRVLELGVPVIGALNGHAVGGGFGLALLCDVRFAREDAKYGAPFARLGIHSGLGIGYLLPRLVGASHAAELLFTGRSIDGRRAEAIGLVSAALPGPEVLARSLALAEEIAAAAPLAVRAMKRSMRRFMEWDVRGAAWEEALAQAETLDTEDAREGVAALLEKRAPTFRGR